MDSSALVQLMPMQQLSEARTADDDWTGVGDQAERRKRQNRLNVRAHRRRKAAQQAQRQISYAYAPTNSGSISDSAQALLIPSFHTKTGVTIPARLVNLFSLSLDHLIPLIEYNVYRATLTNISILGCFDLLSPACGYHSNSLFPLPPSIPAAIPPSLRKTALQEATPRCPPWVDIIPSAAMRDNAIIHIQSGRLRNIELVRDILGGIVGRHDEQSNGVAAEGAAWGDRNLDVDRDDDGGADCRIIAWSDPWDARGWEVSEGFARKWSFLLRGAQDMLEGTNRWRALRGEEPLVWEMN